MNARHRFEWHLRTLVATVILGVGVNVAQAQFIETLDPQPVPFQPTPTRIGHYSNPGQAAGALPGAIFFHFQLFYLGPTNLTRLSDALGNEWQTLSPGQSKTLNIYASKSGDAIVFRFVADATHPNLVPTDVFVISQIKIEAPDRILMSPVSALDVGDLQTCIAADLCSDSIDVTDHIFVAQHLNTVRGTTNGPALVSLTDKTAKAGAAGKVILRANEVSGQYQVFDTATGQVETYNKGASMQARKSTVWILAEVNGREYTIVYNRLWDVESAMVPGADVAAAAKIGEYSVDSDSGVEIWRVNGPSQHFLGNGAHRVAPIQ